MPDPCPVPPAEAATLTDEEFRLASVAAAGIDYNPLSNYWQRVAIAAAKAVVPAIREAERERLLPLLRAADSHITYLSNLVSDHTDLRDWDDGPDLEAAITEIGGDGRG